MAMKAMKHLVCNTSICKPTIYQVYKEGKVIILTCVARIILYTYCGYIYVKLSYYHLPLDTVFYDRKLCNWIVWKSNVLCLVESIRLHQYVMLFRHKNGSRNINFKSSNILKSIIQYASSNWKPNYNFGICSSWGFVLHTSLNWWNFDWDIWGYINEYFNQIFVLCQFEKSK